MYYRRGPIWNEKENKLYFTNGFGREIVQYSFETGEYTLRSLKTDCAAFAFDTDNRIIVSCSDGVFILNDDESMTEIYDGNKLKNANDMKVGPDGRIYVGTQSEKRLGISDKTDAKLYSVDKFGNVKILLDNMNLSNGMEWSIDEKFFYHTDSDTNIIKEYTFDGVAGEISFTGRQITIPGTDGFTIDQNNRLYVACWGEGHIAVVDTLNMCIEKFIDIPCLNPASCCFMGKSMDILAVTTASFETDIKADKNAGFTILIKRDTCGRKPYLFPGEN